MPEAVSENESDMMVRRHTMSLDLVDINDATLDAVSSGIVKDQKLQEASLTSSTSSPP